ncbi:acetyl-CoA acetyltransferase [Paenibacillus sp. JX-17]|uniref:Acetyl-CoA acetyltransferase n=1 Tax=Paenibacillus lacisoli TaxID=3064525 RepID=A0ABT9CE29_9BACL|nr:acetyl-CoA acetyltransferase [Paenibacillus sp. JX-17]MDO7907520.1 acetyl-CoA acetyltransferase [Paenibacillus sp. JX-17]
MIPLTIAQIRAFAKRNVGRRVEVELKSGREIEGVIVFAGNFSLILRRRVRGVFVRVRIFYRNIAEIERDND